MKRLMSVLLSLAACGGSEPESPAGPTSAEALAALRADAAALRARPEHADAQVTFQHCLVGVSGHGTQATRDAAEAELLAAEIYARARGGEDFDLLVKNHTDDAHPGIYVLTHAPEPAPGVYSRQQMVPAFGDTAWRLAVGEVGVAAFDGDAPAPKSPFGWHLVKRLK
jgi:hypothetical protein